MRPFATFRILSALLLLTAAARSQSLTIGSPNGGERWLLTRPVTITWSGDGVAGPVRLILFRNGSAAANRVGTIAEGLPASGSYVWMAGSLVGGSAPAGDGYIVRVREAAEGGAGDNSDAPFTLLPALPNIRCESMRAIGWDHTFLPPTFSAGDTVTIQYHLANDSEFATGPFQVGLRVGGVIVQRTPYAGLANGADLGGEFRWTASCGVAVAVVADCDGAVAESSEGDNTMTDPGLACSAPNLAVRDGSFSGSDPSRVSARMNYQFVAHVRCEASTARNVHITAGVVGGGVLIDRSVALMSPGGDERVEFIWQVPEGTSRVYVEVDGENAIPETNERDNRWELAVTGVELDHSLERYDLVVVMQSPAKAPAIRPVRVELPRNRPVVVRAEARGATGAIRDVVVRGGVIGPDGRSTELYSHTFTSISHPVVPFEFNWTPTVNGAYTIFVRADPGPYALGQGVNDANPANNSARLGVSVVDTAPRLHR